MKNFGFTLAEVLITLAIIGVVAAMTIPTLITTNQEKGWNTASKVFERKLEEALKVMNSQGTLAGYRNTKDFVTELSKHLKIIKICDNNDLMSCFEDSITWNILNISSGTESEIIDLSNVEDASDLVQSDWDTGVVGIQLNNGTSAILAYNPNCKQDPYSNQITGTSCVAMIYDTSGFAKPNSSGKDVRGINSSLNRCKFKSNSTCFGQPFNPSYLTKAECEAQKSDLGINECNFDEDYWAGAVAACGGVNKMPTMAQLAEIADYVYGTSGIGAKEDWDCPSGRSCRDDDKASALGFTEISGAIYVWSGEESSSIFAADRYFYPSNMHWNGSTRNSSDLQAVCLGE